MLFYFLNEGTNEINLSKVEEDKVIDVGYNRVRKGSARLLEL